MPTVSIQPRAARNSELIKLIREGILKPGEEAKATLPSGNEIKLVYVRNNGEKTARELSEMYRFHFDPVPEEYINKSIVNAKGNTVISRHDIVGDETKLNQITEHCANGKIEQVHRKDGSKGGHIWTNDSVNINWGFEGTVANPSRVANCWHENPFKNEHSKEAFKAATDFIRGKSSIEAYETAIAK